MAKIRITKLFSFEMAHALSNYDGKCRNLHGHSYHLRVTVESAGQGSCGTQGMIFDFSQLKEIVQRAIMDTYDHALVLHAGVDRSLLQTLQAHYDKVVLSSCQPTTENLLMEFAHRITQALPAEVRLYALRLAETDTSYAEWLAE